MKLKIIFILFITTFILILIFATEIYLKNVGLGDPVTYDDNYVYGYSPKTNQKKERFNGSYVTINDVGLRSVNDWNKNKENKKIVFFGDSVTYGGSYIDDKDTFAHLTCENLNKSNYICGNAGVNSYGIFNIVFRSRYDYRIKDDDIRIFVVIPDDFYRGLQNYKTAHFYMNNSKYYFPAIVEAINFLSTKYNIKKFISKKLDNNKIKNKKDLIDESIFLFKNEIDRLKKVNKKVLIFYSPSNSENKLNEYIYNKFNNILDGDLNDLSIYLEKDMFKDTVHYNKKGHKIVSEIISKKIINSFNLK